MANPLLGTKISLLVLRRIFVSRKEVLRLLRGGVYDEYLLAQICPGGVRINGYHPHLGCRDGTS